MFLCHIQRVGCAHLSLSFTTVSHSNKQENAANDVHQKTLHGHLVQSHNLSEIFHVLRPSSPRISQTLHGTGLFTNYIQAMKRCLKRGPCLCLCRSHSSWNRVFTGSTSVADRRAQRDGDHQCRPSCGHPAPPGAATAETDGTEHGPLTFGWLMNGGDTSQCTTKSENWYLAQAPLFFPSMDLLLLGWELGLESCAAGDSTVLNRALFRLVWCEALLMPRFHAG